MWALRPMRNCLLVATALLASLAYASAPDPTTWVRHAGDVYDPGIGRSIPAMAGEVWVQWAQGASDAERATLRVAADGALLRRVPSVDGEVLIVTGGHEADAIRVLSASGAVRQASANAIPEFHQVTPRFDPNDALWASGQKAQGDLTRTSEAWQLLVPSTAPVNTPPAFVGLGVVIAIIDSGVDTNHPDLQGSMWVNADEVAGNTTDDDGNGYVDDVYGYDFTNDDGDPNPENDTAPSSHGTCCSGTAAARGNNSIGVAGQVWQSRIMALQAQTLDGVIAALAYATDNGADVVSMSFGFPDQEYQAITDEIIRGYGSEGIPQFGNAVRHGVVYCASMGNGDYDTQQQAPVTSETGDNEVVGVCATDASGVRSNWGGGQQSCYSTREGIADISAPGGAANEVFSTTNLQPTATDPGYINDWGGTSASSPYVAGVAALVRSLDPTLTAAEVGNVLRTTANKSLLYQKNPAFLVQERLGKGVLDAYSAVEAVTKLVPKASVLAPTGGAPIANVTPTITVQAQRSGTRAPALTRVEVVLYAGNADTGTALSTDEVWLDHTASDATAVDAPDGIDDRSGDTYPSDGLFSLKVLSALPVGSTGTALYTVVVTVEDDRDPVEPVTATRHFRVRAVAVPAGRRMVSVPYVLYSPNNLAGAHPAAVLAQPFGEVGEAQIARWDPTGGDPRVPGAYIRSDVAGVDSPYLAVMEPGKAFWVDLPAATPRMFLAGDEVVDDLWLMRDAPYGDDSAGAEYLAAGWHMISNPFASTADLASFLVETVDGRRLPIAAAVEEGICRGVLYHYNGSGYTAAAIPNAVLEPYDGYWFRTLASCKLYAVPPSTASVASTRALAKAPAWSVALTASCGTAESAITVGADASATADFDPCVDLEQPPVHDDRLVASLAAVDGSSDLLLQDIRGVSDTATWTIRVGGRVSGSGELAWGDLRSLPRDLSLILTDTVSGESVSLRHASQMPFTVSAGETREFTLVAARTAQSGLAVRILDTATARGVSDVAFRLSAPAEVDVTIANAAGRVVRTLLSGGLRSEGVSTLAWDGRDDRGVSVPRGAFTVSITARSAAGEVARATASVVR